jgi:SAM-dependent methyltransferase
VSAFEEESIMSFESLMRVTQRLTASMEALAALGAELRLRRDGASAHPQTRQLLQEIVRGIDPDLLNDITADQEAIALAVIRVAFHEAIDLLDDPARAPGWLHEDPAVLQTIGKRSRRVVHQINAFAAMRPGLKKAIERNGAFLDIGTGVGWLAIEAARTWPMMKVVGIDIWEPSLALAASNVAASDLQDRVALRRQSVADLEDREAFTVVFCPVPFLPREVAEVAMANAFRALVPGGWVVFGLFPPPPDPLGEALTALKIVRCGGHPWTQSEAEERLRGCGFEEVETFAPASLSRLSFGRKPG